MEARAIQIYKPVNKNEVRLVYRIKNSTVAGENGRHQKSYSFNKYGEENAWNMARDAFKFINNNNKLPFDFSDPLRAKLVNKRGRKSLGYNNGSSTLDGQGSPPVASKRLASLKNELYGEDLAEGSVLRSSRGGRNGSPPSISSVKFASLRDHYEVDLSSSPESPQVSPNLIYEFEGKFSDLGMKNGRHEDYHLPSSSYLHLLAAAATEIFEKQEIHVGKGENAARLGIRTNFLQEEGYKGLGEDSMSPSKVEDTGFASPFCIQAIQQNQNTDLNFNQSSLSCALSSLPEIPKIILNPERYYSLANMPLYNVPLYFNGQASGSQYASALINSANQHFMFVDPSLAYLPGNHR